MLSLKEIEKNAESLRQYKKDETFLHLLPDTENEFIKVFEIQKPSEYEVQENWMNIIADAYADYYRNSEIYDESEEDIGPVELVLNAIKLNNIPLVRYWEAVNVEVLNVRWLNKQI